VNSVEDENGNEQLGMGSGAAEYAGLEEAGMELNFPSELEGRLGESEKTGVAHFLTELDAQRAEAGDDRVPYIEGITEDGTLVIVDELRGDSRGQRFGENFVVYVTPVESFGEQDFQPTATDPHSIIGLREKGGYRTSIGAADEDDRAIFGISKTAPQRTGEAEPNAMFRVAGGEYTMVHPLRGESIQEQEAESGSRIAAAREALDQATQDSGRVSEGPARVPAGERVKRRGFLRRRG
jgi:hypothetical protein